MMSWSKIWRWNPPCIIINVYVHRHYGFLVNSTVYKLHVSSIYIQINFQKVVPTMQYKQESECLWRSENRKIDLKIQNNDKEKTSSVSY